MNKKLILPERIRKIKNSFSWIDHRFINDGFINRLSQQEIIIYLFLVAVGDKNGVILNQVQDNPVSVYPVRCLPRWIASILWGLLSNGVNYSRWIYLL